MLIFTDDTLIGKKKEKAWKKYHYTPGKWGIGSQENTSIDTLPAPDENKALKKFRRAMTRLTKWERDLLIESQSIPKPSQLTLAIIACVAPTQVESTIEAAKRKLKRLYDDM